MKPEAAQAELSSRLEAAGVRLGDGPFDTAAPARAWDAFKQFAQVPVEGMDYETHSDGLLFEAGYFESFQEPAFNFEMVRQFSFDDDAGEYHHMEQLRCCFYYAPTPELRELSGQLWSFDLPLDDFFRQVEQLPAFRVPVERGLTPVRAEVVHDEV